jgi:hypothetical protein
VEERRAKVELFDLGPRAPVPLGDPLEVEL